MERFYSRMPKVGIEPTYPRVHDFESCASAYSATSAGEESILNRPPRVKRQSSLTRRVRDKVIETYCYRRLVIGAHYHADVSTVQTAVFHADDELAVHVQR